MALSRIGPKHQVTIPKEAFERLGLHPGDYVDVRIRGDVLYLVPQKLAPRDQAWFWTKNWQEMENEADSAIERGEISDEFTDADLLVRYLRSL